MITTVEQIRRILELPSDPKARISREDREWLYAAALCDRGLAMQRELRKEQMKERKRRVRIKSTLRQRALRERRFDEKFKRLIKMLSRRGPKGRR
jgi:hypothetical protein